MNDGVPWLCFVVGDIFMVILGKYLNAIMKMFNPGGCLIQDDIAPIYRAQEVTE